MTRSFHTSFWLGTAVAALASALILRSVAAPNLIEGAAEPPIPVPDGSYVSAYKRGHADHYLFRFGLLGFGEKIKRSDILVLGSSHAELGISAAELSDDFSKRLGRKVRAFNLGLGFGEGMPFARGILEHNDVTHKTVVLDLFAPLGTGISAFGGEVMRADIAEAYASVGEIWADYARDWLLDGLLPRLEISDRLVFKRFLDSAVVFRRWDTGDVSEIWQPDNGMIYRDPGRLAHTFGNMPPDTIPAIGGTSFSNEDAAFLLRCDLHPLLTLIPYPGYDPDAARSAARAHSLAFLAIWPTGLQYWDSNHLSAAGRDIATKRLSTDALAVIGSAPMASASPTPHQQ